MPVIAYRPRPQTQAPPLGVRAPGAPSDVTRVAKEWRARYRKGAELLGSYPPLTSPALTGSRVGVACTASPRWP